MWTHLETFFHANPVGLLAAILGFGYLLGKTSFRGFNLGSISGVLFVGLIFGHLGFEANAMVQSFGFILFIFSVGLQAGPSFFSVLRQEGLKYFVLALVIAVTGFTLALFLSKWLAFEPGTAAGLLSGGLTSSPTLAAAQDALRGGNIPVPEGFTNSQMMTNVATAYAITYIFGLVGLILIIRFLPKMLKIDLAGEAATLASQTVVGIEDRTHGLENIQVRAYRLTNPKVDGLPVSEVYERLPGKISVEKVKRNDEFLPVTPDLKLKIGDEVTLIGFLEEFVARSGNVGPELADSKLLDVSLESCRIVVLRSKIKKVRSTLGRFTSQSGCFVSHIKRLGLDIPLQGDIQVQAGDVLHVTGPPERLKYVGEMVGHIERETEETDLVTVMLGITAGLMVGGLSVSVFGISVGLGTAGGLLVAGLVIGYLRALHPTFGRVPGAARWIFMELGLMLFMAGVGLRAGSGILETLAESGASLFLAGIVVTIVPVAVGYLVGKKVLGLNPVYLMGAITGSMTSGASLSIVISEAKSSLPSLGYTGAYAFANVMLTVAGSIILLL